MGPKPTGGEKLTDQSEGVGRNGKKNKPGNGVRGTRKHKGVNPTKTKESIKVVKPKRIPLILKDRGKEQKVGGFSPKRVFFQKNSHGRGNRKKNRRVIESFGKVETITPSN